MNSTPTEPGPKRNHHFLPRFYLKGFTSPENEGFLWVYTKGMKYEQRGPEGRSPRLLPISRVAARRDHYAYQMFRGKTDYETIENQLERLEKKADREIRALRESTRIGVLEKKVLASYISMMIKRGQRSESKAPQMVREHVENFSWDDMLRDLQHRGKLKTAHELAANRDELKSHLQQEILKRRVLVAQKRVEAALVRMRWDLLLANEPSFFLTCDSPVWFDESLGIRNQNAAVVFPISSSRAILASWMGSDVVFEEPLVEDKVYFFNSLILRGAQREVYACRKEPWIVADWHAQSGESWVL